MTPRGGGGGGGGGPLGLVCFGNFEILSDVVWPLFVEEYGGGGGGGGARVIFCWEAEEKNIGWRRKKWRKQTYWRC